MQQANAHIVTGSGILNAQGNAGVALANAAVFTGPDTYVCMASYGIAPSGLSPALTVSIQSGTSFIVRGLPGANFAFVCVGH
jgi:hypothetical protein